MQKVMEYGFNKEGVESRIKETEIQMKKECVEKCENIKNEMINIVERFKNVKDCESIKIETINLIKKGMTMINQIDKINNENTKNNKTNWQMDILTQLIEITSNNNNNNDNNEETSLLVEQKERQDFEDEKALILNDNKLDNESESDSNTLKQLCLLPFDKITVNRYFQDLKLINKQKNRIKNDIYPKIKNINKLIDQNNEKLKQLSNEAQLYQNEQTKMQAKFIATTEEYDDKCKFLIDTFTKETNLMSESSAKSYECEQLTKIYQIKYQQTAAKHNNVKNISNKLCTDLKYYRDYERINDENIELLENKYKQVWNNFEKWWYKWDIDNLVLYLKFKFNNNNNNNDNNNEYNCDWNKIERTMKEENFKGEYLNNVDKTELKLFGFTDYNTRKMVYDIIQNVCNNNPRSKANDDNHVQKSEKKDVSHVQADIQGQVISFS